MRALLFLSLIAVSCGKSDRDKMREAFDKRDCFKQCCLNARDAGKLPEMRRYYDSAFFYNRQADTLFDKIYGKTQPEQPKPINCNCK